MRSLVDAEVSQHTMKLQQMGAKVKVINSTLCYVSFDLSGFLVQYVYNINSKGNYFLERMKPYPLALKEVNDEKEIIQVIKEDVEKFKNALRCHHIDSFITIARQINVTFKKFEETFLNYNIPSPKVEKMLKKIQALDLEIQLIQENAAKILLESSDLEE